MVSVETLRVLAHLISQSRHLVALTGAGMSTASGIPDFREPWNAWQSTGGNMVPIRVDKTWDRFDPNEGHIALKRLQEMGYLKFLISQNTDGLHLKSGFSPRHIAELHGNCSLMVCCDCGSKWHVSEIGWDIDVYGQGKLSESLHPHQPQCLTCGGRVVSTLIGFGDRLPKIEITKARSHSKKSDLFLVLGSSLSVFPASSLPRIAKKHGSKVIIVNIGETKLDHLADIKIEDDVSVVVPKLVNLVSLSHYKLP